MKTLIRTTRWILHKWWLWLLLVLCSCTNTKYIPVESVKVDTCYIKQVERDSVYERDSIIVYKEADTVFHIKTQLRFRDRIVRDTVFRVRCDSLSRVVEVEKALTSWERTKMSVGGYAIVCACLLVAIWFAKRLKGL